MIKLHARRACSGSQTPTGRFRQMSIKCPAISPDALSLSPLSLLEVPAARRHACQTPGLTVRSHSQPPT
eukprot:scaffold175696_cov31-Tisochrysis_lutea.AAC.1